VTGIAQNYCIQSAGIRAMSLNLIDAAGNSVPFVSLPLVFNIPGNNLGNAANQLLLAAAVNSAFGDLQRVISGLDPWPTYIKPDGTRGPKSLQAMFASFINTRLNTLYDANGIINEPSARPIKETGMDSSAESMRVDNVLGAQTFLKFTIQNPDCRCL
jgi:hypothetical protein